MTNHQLSSEFESGCGVKKKALEKCTQNPVKCPVENQEDVTPPKTESSNMGMLSKELTSDVEEDSCPTEVIHTNPVNAKNIEFEKTQADVEDKLSILSLQDTNSGEPPEKMGVKTENSVETAPCDKAAKDLSNLLKTLSLGEEKSKDLLHVDDGVVSILDDIDKSLAQLRLSTSSSSSPALKCRGYGDGPMTTNDPWSPWSGDQLDLGPAADLANYFSQQNGDMFGTTQFPDQYRQTPTYPKYTWSNTVPGLNSTSQSIAFDPSQSSLTTSSVGNLYQDLSGPPSSHYRCQFSYSDRLPNTTSFLHLLNSEDDPAKHLPNNESDDNLDLGAKRTKYTHLGSPLVNTAEPKVQYPTSDTSQLTHNNQNRFMTNSQPPNLYKSSQSEVARSPEHPMGGSPSAQVYHSPAHRLSPESCLSSPYQPYSVQSIGMPSPTLSSSVSSGYNGDFAASSPGSVFSVCPSSALPDSPRSLGPYSPTDTSPSYLSPQNSPTDSGLSTSHGSPYSELNVNGSSPESEPSYAPSVSAVPFSQTSASFTGALVSNTQVSHPSIICPDPTVLSSTSAVSTTTVQPPTDESGNLLFEYSNEDGDSILHILVMIFETLVFRGQRKSAFSFLHYFSQKFLKHPLMKQKLNKQNNMLQTPLYLAVQGNLLPVVQLLVKSGADVDRQGRCEKLHEDVPRMDGPLHAAVRFGDDGVVLVKSLLSSNTANINTQNTEGETPLYIALKEHGRIYMDDKGRYQVKSCIKLIDVLLKHGADMDIKEYKSGKTPLMVAIETKDVALVRMVLDNCNPRDLHYLLNDSTRDLNTCMHVAFGLTNITEPKHTELVRMLMMKGGEAESENNTNLKAKDMAPNVFKKAVKIFR